MAPTPRQVLPAFIECVQLKVPSSLVWRPKKPKTSVAALAPSSLDPLALEDAEPEAHSDLEEWPDEPDVAEDAEEVGPGPSADEVKEVLDMLLELEMDDTADDDPGVFDLFLGDPEDEEGLGHGGGHGGGVCGGGVKEPEPADPPLPPDPPEPEPADPPLAPPPQLPQCQWILLPSSLTASR